MNRKSILSGKIFAIAWIFVLMATAAPIVFASNGSTASGVSSQWKVEEGGNLSEGASGEEYKFVTKWDNSGTGDGTLFFPCGIAADSSGNVFVTDSGIWLNQSSNNRTLKFDSNGNFITKWGSYGTGEGEFYFYDGAFTTVGIAVDNSGNVFVTDRYNNRIQKFDSNGNFITKWGSSGFGDGEFYEPAGIAVDNSGNVFVTDTFGCRIQKFDSNGNFITKWGSYGFDDGAFFDPYAIAVDNSGNVFVADTGNMRIQKFDSNGNFITKWGSYGSIYSFGSFDDGQFDWPCGIAVDNSGNVFVADTWNDQIQKFDSNGHFITKWGVGGIGEGAFCEPTGIAVDNSGNVFVADTGNMRIQKFAPGTPQPNQPPTLSSGYVTPASGDTSTTFDYYVTYKDPEGDAPTTKHVYIDGSTHTMTKLTGDYTSGANFTYSTTLSEEDHNYYFYFDDGHAHTKRLPTSGTFSGPIVGTTTPDIAVSPSSHDFGSVNVGFTSSAKTFTVSNTGGLLIIGSITLTGTDAAEFSIRNDECSGWTSAPPATCTVDVVFSPTLEGAKSVNLTIPSNDLNTPLNVPLTGTAVGVNKPDLTPFKITWVPSSPDTSDNITVTLHVKNQGDTDAAVKFYTKLYVDDVEKGSWYTDSLTAGKSAQASKDIGTLSAGDHTVKVVIDPTGIIDESDESNNIYSKTLTVKGVKPDLTPFKIIWVPSSPGTSDNISITWNVKNQGDTDAVAKFHTKLYVDDVEKGSWYTDSIATGKSVHASEDIGTLSAGDHMVKVVTDTTGTIDESDESNNIYSKTLTVTGINKPDLTPFEITWMPSSPGTSDNITVTLQVKNQGDTDAVAKFHTKLYVDDVEKGSWNHPSGLTAGYSAQASEDIGTLSAGDHTVKVVTDTTGTIDESDESNNIYSKTLTVFTGANILDTGKPAKPYPSMMGTHEGTIIPSSDITISKLYTYPCAGTGGHTESIKLYENGTLKTSGAWYGYQSDWHNITMTPPVILRAGHTYVYTIVTGSYPQIIHAKSKDVTGGTITCDEFVDTNGKKYSDWIPAIKLLGRDAPTDYATPNWLHFGYDNSYTAYNPLESTINITNVAQLERKWGVGCDDPAYSSITSSPAIYNGTLYTRFKISPSYSKLHAYDARTGQMLWQFSKNNTGRTPQPVVSEDGIIFDMEGSYPTNLYAIDADTGAELWEAPIAFDLDFTETALVTVDEENNVVYLVDFGLRGEGKLFALDKQTGEIVWFKNKATDDVSFEGDYVLLNEGKIFAVAEAPKQQYTTNMDHMLRIDASSHDIEIIFDRPEPEGYYHIKHYALCNDKLVVGFDNQYEPVKLLVAYDPDSPTIVWQKEYLEITGKIACNTTKNVIYVPTDPYLYALDVTTGEELWKYMGYGEIYNPSVANGIVYFLSDTNVYAINEDTGERLFSYPLGKKADEGAQVAICEGMLYFSGNCGTCDLYALGLSG